MKNDPNFMKTKNLINFDNHENQVFNFMILNIISLNLRPNYDNNDFCHNI